MATQEELNELRNKIVKQMGSPLGPGVMSNKEAETAMSALSSNEAQPMSPTQQSAAQRRAMTESDTNKITNILQGAGSPSERRAMTESDTNKITEAINTPGTIEYNIEQIRKNMERETQISPERQAFIDGRQELINEVLMPLSSAGYKELVDIILTKPRDSVEHDQASIELAKVAAQMDDEFNPDEFDMMLNMVSKEPRPADLINPEGLPDKNAETIRQEQQGIGALE